MLKPSFSLQGFGTPKQAPERPTLNEALTSALEVPPVVMTTAPGGDPAQGTDVVRGVP